MSGPRPDHLRLVDGDGVPRPGHHFPGRVRLLPSAIGSCSYPLEAGVWYPVAGVLPSLDLRRRQWLVILTPGDPPVPVDEHLLELGPDDPEGFGAWAEGSRGEEANGAG